MIAYDELPSPTLFALHVPIYPSLVPSTTRSTSRCIEWCVRANSDDDNDNDDVNKTPHLACIPFFINHSVIPHPPTILSSVHLTYQPLFRTYLTHLRSSPTRQVGHHRLFLSDITFPTPYLPITKNGPFRACHGNAVLVSFLSSIQNPLSLFLRDKRRMLWPTPYSHTPTQLVSPIVSNQPQIPKGKNRGAIPDNRTNQTNPRAMWCNVIWNHARASSPCRIVATYLPTLLILHTYARRNSLMPNLHALHHQ